MASVVVEGGVHDDAVVPHGNRARCPAKAALEFRRGDVNDDGGVSLPDVIVLLGYLFPQGPPPGLVCDDAADANDDNRLNLADPVWGLSYLFRGGPAPPHPFPEPGFDDQTPGDLPCDL